jgi:tight adherence protein C
LAILFCIVIAGFAVFSSIIVGTIVALSIAIIIPGERIKKRTADTEKYLPDLLDMASLLARSGVDIIESIIRSRVVAGSGALRDDIAGLSRLMAAGLGRQEALQDISRRTPSANFRSVLSFVIGADRMGSGTADILEDVAKRLRQKRIMLALKKGGRNSQLALVPLVFFIMPSTILVVFGPLVVRYLQGGVDALLR